MSDEDQLTMLAQAVSAARRLLEERKVEADGARGRLSQAECNVTNAENALAKYLAEHHREASIKAAQIAGGRR